MGHKNLNKAETANSDLGAVSGSLLEEATNLLKDYEQWEADIINEDKLWWPNTAQDVMRGKIYDTMMDLQEKRNNLLRRLNCR
jgi:hypothetical protein